MWFLYEQETGRFYDCFHPKRHELMATGYSGKGIGRNNPDFQSIPRVGPIPRGVWTILPAKNHPRLGRVSLPLEAVGTHPIFERSGFYIHGDNAASDGSASEGCIILPHHVRAEIDLRRVKAHRCLNLVVERRLHP